MCVFTYSAHTNGCMNVCMYICIYMCTHTHTHTHTHKVTNLCLQPAATNNINTTANVLGAAHTHTAKQHTLTPQSCTHSHRKAAHTHTAKLHTLTPQSSTHSHRKAAHTHTAKLHTPTPYTQSSTESRQHSIQWLLHTVELSQYVWAVNKTYEHLACYVLKTLKFVVLPYCPPQTLHTFFRCFFDRAS